MTDAPELLPCPFCGEAPIGYEYSIPGSYTVECHNEKCVVRPCTPDYGSHDDGAKQKAIAAWNTRADLAAAQVAEAVAKERERCALIAYATCAETRHVTLGNQVAAAIRARKGEG